MNEITILGIDLAKNTFQLIGVEDQWGQCGLINETLCQMDTP